MSFTMISNKPLFLIRKSFPMVSSLDVLNHFCTTQDTNEPQGRAGVPTRNNPVDVNRLRAGESRGAMSDFLTERRNNVNPKQGVWAKIRSSLTDSDNTSNNVPSRSARLPSLQNSHNTTANINNRAERINSVESRDRGTSRIRNERYANKSRSHIVKAPPRSSLNDDIVDENKISRFSGARRRGDDSDEDALATPKGINASSEDIPDHIKPILFDVEYFKNLVDRGETIDTTGMDHFDSWMAHKFVESVKSENGIVREVIKSNDFDKVSIPKARPLSHLLSTINPNIYSVTKDSDGYKIAANAWHVLSKNYYFTDKQKENMCNVIAKKAENIFKTAEAAKQQNAEVDGIFAFDFKKGLPGIEAEKLKRAMYDGTPVKEDTFVQGKTDWDQTAVVDEDQLR